MTKNIHFGILFLVSILITGFPLWVTSYAELSVGKIIMVDGVLALVTTWIAGVLAGRQYLWIVFSVAGGFFIAYIIKTVLDLAHNPTDHNLLPFELIFVGFIAACVTFSGIALAWITRKLFRFS
jgi:hypothetical protein